MGCALVDQRMWAQANPAYGYTIMPATLRKDCALDPQVVFLTECLCIRVEALEVLMSRTAWESNQVDRVRFNGLDERIAACLDVAPDSEHATLVIAAVNRETNRTKVRVVKSWTGREVDRIEAELPELLEKLAPRRFGWFPNGPAAAKGTTLRSVQRSREITTVAEACQELVDAVRAGQLEQAADPLLTAQILGVKKIMTGDGFRFVRVGVGHADAVYAAAGALRMAREMSKSTGVGVA